MATPDPTLLERFATHQDQGAFAEIVRRHGGLVMGACRRVLRNPDDAEEAFQATFLILARKAGSVRKGESLAQWLHAVAVRTAINARSSALRRTARERSVVPRAPSPSGEGVGPVLDEEVTRLPDKYRSPLLLCYFQGKTTESAASELGWARGTVLTRLARAREMLRERLAVRGVVTTGAVLASVAVTEAVAAATVKSAAVVAQGGMLGSTTLGTLVNGGLKAMLVAKVKSAAIVMVATTGVLASGGALLASRVQDKPTVTVAMSADTLPPKIPYEKFDRFHKMLLPTKDELVGFWDLPWEVGIHAARERASAENKPILAYFGANGSSLGAT